MAEHTQVDALLAALADIERHVSSAGWDQPARLFALVETQQLVAAEPALAEHLAGALPDSFSAVEQDGFHAGDDLERALARIYWPDTVAGCAIAVERAFLAPEHEAEIPNDDSAADFVANHADRQDVRVVVGVLRDGTHHGLARIVSAPDDLLGGEDLVPGLAAALLGTLKETPDKEGSSPS